MAQLLRSVDVVIRLQWLWWLVVVQTVALISAGALGGLVVWGLG